MEMQRRAGIHQSLSLGISYGACMSTRYIMTYSDTHRGQPRFCHSRAIYIMSDMIWIHSLMNQAAMNRGLHVSAGYVVYLYVFMTSLPSLDSQSPVDD